MIIRANLAIKKKYVYTLHKLHTPLTIPLDHVVLVFKSVQIPCNEINHRNTTNQDRTCYYYYDHNMMLPAQSEVM